MMRRLLLSASIVLLLSCISTGSFSLATDVVAQAPPSQAPTPSRGPGSANMQGMMKMHSQMMADMKAADAKLDALVTAMNASSGDAKLNAVAAVVTELVRQQKSMHEHMGQMHEQMMGGGMMMK
jgi:hypothetical protein